MLNQMTREQLVSLLCEILRRLLAPTQPTHSAVVSCPAIPIQDGQLVVDPTIDAWEHIGIYPPDASVWGTLSGLGGMCFIIGGPPCAVFCRPWQPGDPSPTLALQPETTDVVSQSDDPWAAPEVLVPPMVNQSRCSSLL